MEPKSEIFRFLGLFVQCSGYRLGKFGKGRPGDCSGLCSASAQILACPKMEGLPSNHGPQQSGKAEQVTRLNAIATTVAAQDIQVAFSELYGFPVIEEFFSESSAPNLASVVDHEALTSGLWLMR